MYTKLLRYCYEPPWPRLNITGDHSAFPLQMSTCYVGGSLVRTSFCFISLGNGFLGLDCLGCNLRMVDILYGQ